MGSELFEEEAGSDDARVGGICLEDVAFANDVIADDDGAGAGEADGPLEVDRVVGFIGVEEDEVEGGCAFGLQLSE